MTFFLIVKGSCDFVLVYMHFVWMCTYVYLVKGAAMNAATPLVFLLFLEPTGELLPSEAMDSSQMAFSFFVP